MLSYLLTASLVAGATLLLFTVQKSLDRRFVAPPSKASNPTVPLPHRVEFIVGQWARQAGAFACAAFLVSIFMVKISPALALAGGQLGGLALCVIFLGAVIYCVVACRLRCLGCNRLLLWKVTRTPPFLRKGLETRALHTRTFQCMYCGQRYVL